MLEPLPLISSLVNRLSAILFGTSILGPATIFLLIVGALETALLSSINIMWSFTIVFFPVILFFIVAMTQKEATQVSFMLGLFF